MSKSHVYVAESILKRFSSIKNKKRVVYYIDYINKTVKCSPVASFNTIENYYTTKNEKVLSDKIESKIGTIISKLQQLSNSNSQNLIKLSPLDLQIIKNYISYQLIRDDGIINLIKEEMLKKPLSRIPMSNEKNEELAEFRLKFILTDNKTIKNQYITNEEKGEFFKSFFDDMGVVLYINKTNIKCVLCNTTNTISPESQKYFAINYSLSPELFVRLCQKDALVEAFANNANNAVVRIIGEATIKEYNNNLYYTAKKNSPHILIGDEKELNKLLMEDV